VFRYIYFSDKQYVGESIIYQETKHGSIFYIKMKEVSSRIVNCFCLTQRRCAWADGKVASGMSQPPSPLPVPPAKANYPVCCNPVLCRRNQRSHPLIPGNGVARNCSRPGSKAKGQKNSKKSLQLKGLTKGLDK
jgi:hypothetical protein